MTTAIASKARILTDNPVSDHCADNAWQQAMRRSITDPEELLTRLGLGNEWLPAAHAASKLFPLRVPHSYVARMAHGDPDDPLLRQVLPLAEECIPAEGYVSDAVGDIESLRGRGLLQKYHGRALLIATGACAVHCRFCFRREFPYQNQLAARDQWQESLGMLRQDESIEEIILSGGDPLSLSDSKLSWLARQLDEIPHLHRLRIHTRQPIVLPERVNASLHDWLSNGRLQRIIVLHCNHAREIDADTSLAFQHLADTGAVLLNQAVLLRGVNDSVDALRTLSEELFKNRVLPYYLHLPDRVNGTAHFDVPEAVAQNLMRKLATVLPGYMMPKLVREESGKPSKTLVSW